MSETVEIVKIVIGAVVAIVAPVASAYVSYLVWKMKQAQSQIAATQKVLAAGQAITHNDLREHVAVAARRFDQLHSAVAAVGAAVATAAVATATTADRDCGPRRA